MVAAPEPGDHEDDQGDAGVQGRHDELRRPDALVPPRPRGRGERPGEHRVHRDRQRDDHDGHDAEGACQHPALPGCTDPAAGDGRIGPVPEPTEPGRRVLVQDRHVRQQRQREEHDRRDGVGRDGDEVPEHRCGHVGLGDELVEPARVTDVRDDQGTSDEDGADRGALGEAGERRSPLGAGEPQDGRDHGTAVAHADERDDVSDVDGPERVVVVAGRAHPLAQLHGPGVAARPRRSWRGSRPAATRTRSACRTAGATPRGRRPWS